MDINTAVSNYLNLKEEIKSLEKQQKGYEAFIMSHAEKTGERKFGKLEIVEEVSYTLGNKERINEILSERNIKGVLMINVAALRKTIGEMKETPFADVGVELENCLVQTVKLKITCVKGKEVKQ